MTTPRRKAPAAPTTPLVTSAPPTPLTDTQREALDNAGAALGTPEVFRDWLKQQIPGVAGYVHDPSLHPLAQWLSLVTGTAILVQARTYRLRNDYRYAGPLPAWACSFNARLLAIVGGGTVHAGRVLAAECLKALAEVRR